MSRNSRPRNIYRKQRRVVTLGTAWFGKTALLLKYIQLSTETDDKPSQHQCDRCILGPPN